MKSVAAAVTLAVSSTCVFSAVTADGKRFYVEGIIPNSQAIENNLLQLKTGYNNSCGPTALLFIDNHYVRRYTGSSPAHLLTLQLAKDSITRVYQRINVPLNHSSGTSLDQMATVARQWGYTNVRRRSASTAIDTNIDSLMDSLTHDRPALAILNGQYHGYPLGGAKVDHIVIIFAYNKMSDEFGRAWNHPQNTRKMDLIEYYEPYYGYMRTLPRKDLFLPAVSGIQKRAFNITNFSYLQVGR